MKMTLASTHRLSHQSAFTLVEALIVMATLVVLAGSLIMCNLYGVSMACRQQIWLSSSDDAAQAIGMLMTDVRSGQSNAVGRGNLGGFTNTPQGTRQAGNALKIWVATTNTGTNVPWILYYYDPSSSNLYRTNYTGSSQGDFRMVSANRIQTNNTYNSNIFSLYDYLGNPVDYSTNNTCVPIVQVCLGFTALQNPQIVIAPGGAVSFYQIVTTIASRNRP
ncbi:MAG: prepilin-type N-terminal cleavage/methylation domain-containing protein [Limisphaerales bacterium]